MIKSANQRTGREQSCDASNCVTQRDVEELERTKGEEIEKQKKQSDSVDLSHRTEKRHDGSNYDCDKPFEDMNNDELGDFHLQRISSTPMTEKEYVHYKGIVNGLEKAIHGESSKIWRIPNLQSN